MGSYIIVFLIFSQVWIEKTFTDFSDGREFVEYNSNFVQWNPGVRILPTIGGRLKIIGQDWDFNDDGYIDIALTYQYRSTVKIFWNSQNGFDTTNFHQFKGLNPAPQHVLVVDLNNDDIEDFVIPSSHGPYTDSKINIYYGDSTGFYPEFPDEVITRCPPSTEDAKAADFNRDGYLDLVFSGRDTTFIILGPPPFSSKPWWKFISWPGGHHDFANPADFNSDGEIDIAIYRHEQGYLRIYYGPDFNTYTHLNTPAGRGIEIADLNKDGYLDIVHDGNSHGIYWGSPQGYSDNNYTALNAEPAFGDICIQDFNKDGNLDILLNGDDYAYIFWGDTFLNFTRIKQEWRAECALSADWNNDGYMDIAVSSPFGNYTYLFYNINGNFNYNPDFTFHMGSNNALEIDLGNIYTREKNEGYISNVYNTGTLSDIDSVKWFGNIPSPCSLVFELRYSSDGVNWSNWIRVKNGENVSINGVMFMQYRIKFFTDFSHTTKFYIDSVKIYYSPSGNYGISVEPDTSSTTYENTPISYIMRIKNLGNYGDTVLLSSYSSANGVVSQIYDSSGMYQIDRIFVDSGETKNIILRIIPPPTVPQVLVDTTILEGVLKSYPSIKDRATVITYILKQGTQHGIIIEPDTSGITQTSMPIIYNMRVYNYGFVDDTVLLNVTWKRSDVICIILDSFGINPINDLFVKSLQMRKFKLKVIPPNMLTVPFIYDTASVKGVVKADTNVKDIAFVYTQIYDPRFTYDIIIKPDTSINTTNKNVVIPMKLFLKNSPFDSVNLGLLYNEDSIQCVIADTTGNYVSDLKVTDTFDFNLNINISKKGRLRDTIKVLGLSYFYPNSKDTAFVILVRDPEMKEYIFDIHNYESPFKLRDGTNFVVTIPEDGFLTIRIYDRLGREIKALVSHKLFEKGEHLIFWKGKDNYGRLVSPGTYIYVAEFESLKGIQKKSYKENSGSSLNKIILILILCSQSKREALPILREPLSARISALGEALTCVTKDPGSFILNPAAVSTFPYLSLFCFYNKNFMDIRDILVGTILKERKFFVSPFFIYSNSGNVEVRDLNDNLIFLGNIQSTYIPGITISGVFKNMYLGFSFKYVYDKIYQTKGEGFLFDLGILSELNKNLNFGLIFKNLGAGINYGKEVFPSPFFVRTGFSFNWNFFNLYFDTEYNKEDKFEFFSGIEFKIKDILFLRTGYKLVDRLNKYTFGFGIRYRNLNFDYSYQPFYYLGNSNKFSFAISFQRFKEKVTSLYIVTIDSFEKLPVSVDLQLEGVLNRKVSTDRNGKFFYEDIEPGTLIVRVIDPDFEETEKVFIIERDKKNVLRMSVVPYRLVSVVFKIIDKETNEKVAAEIYYKGPINAFLKALSGEAKIKRIVTGNYFLKVVPLDSFYKEREIKLDIYKSDTFYIYLEGEEVELKTIYFETASTEIKEEYIPFLSKLGEYLRHRPSKKIVVYGHTDSREVHFKYPSNQVLSIKRAEAVKNYLVEKFNIDPSRIEIKGFGATRPAVPNTSPQNMAKNRRVVIVFKN